MANVKQTLNFLTPVLSAALLIACSDTNFSAAKSQLLKQSVFGTGDATGIINQPGGSSSGSITQPGGGSSGSNSSGSVHQPGGNGSSGSVQQPSSPGTNAGGSINQPGGSGGGFDLGGWLGSIGQPVGGSSSGSVSQPSLPNSSGSIGQSQGDGATNGITQGTTSGIPVKYVCSTSEADMWVGTSVSKASSVELKVMDPSGNVVCDQIAGVKESIVQTKSLDFSSCHLTGNSYTVTLTDPNKPSMDLLYVAGSNGSSGVFQNDSISIARTSASAPWTATSNMSALQDGVQMNTPTWMFTMKSVVGVLWAGNPSIDHDVDASDCDVSASPLVVNMTPKGEADPGMQLSAPRAGVWFDILGLNSNPYPHAKKLISWIQNPNYMFLALPRHGQVKGVDELFGNNTFGPDYTFAENGFAALAKYDLNHDGKIDAKDPIFQDLRLWSDKNKDGIAQPEELKSLQELGLEEIDLQYDSSYYERDQYGNESRFRSDVKSANGQLHMIFDLWFSLSAN